MTNNIKRAAIFLLLLSGSITFAEDPARGRMPDGRAYRTDNDGNQLVDYIAELEVQNESLMRRMNGLEYENQQKQARIEDLSRGAGAQRTWETGLAERQVVQKTEACPPAPRLPEPQAVAVTQVDDSACKTELAATQADNNTCRTQLATVQEATTAARFDLESQRKKFEEQMGRSQEQIAALEQRLEASTTQVRAFENQAARASAATEVSTTRAAARIIEPDRVPVAAVIPTEARSVSEKPQLFIEEEPRARLETEPATVARDRALVTVRGSISTELNKLRSLIAQRDRLFGDYNRNRQALNLKATTLRSSRDMTLNDIERVLQSATSVYQLTSVRADINELRGMVNEDIGLVQRMSHSR